MPKRKKVEEASADVSVEVLQYWADYHVGGSGMGIRTQNLLKNMARELLEHRKTNTIALHALADTLDAEINPGSRYAGQRLRRILNEELDNG